MAKLSVISMVRNILNAMDSDDVYTINETPEALQVAEIVKETYYQLIANTDIPENYTLVKLEALSDLDRPNYLKMPDNIKAIHSIKYDKIKSGESRHKYDEVHYLPVEEFLERSHGLDNTRDDVIEVEDFNGVKYYIEDDVAPDYYTTFDDKYIVFNSYDSDIDSTIQNSKTACIAQTFPSFTMSDDFVPELDVNLFPLLLAEAKSMCFNTLKQAPNALIERRAREQRIRMQNDKHRVRVKSTGYPDYGRK